MGQMINQDMDANMSMNANMGATKKEGKGMMIGMICCALLAVGGLAFGIYEMTQANQAKQQISNLKIEIKNDDGSTTTLETDKIEVKEETQTITITDSAAVAKSGPYIEEGYFLVPEWGLKFKIPEGLVEYGFSVNYNSARGDYKANGPTIGFSAMLSQYRASQPQAAYYDDIETCAITTVKREAGVYEENHPNQYINGSIAQFDGYALEIWNTIATCDYNYHLDETGEVIREMFRHPESI